VEDTLMGKSLILVDHWKWNSV